MTKKNLLAFPPAGHPTANESSSSESLLTTAVGQALVAVWQTPCMAEVCIREADGVGYRCRIALQLEFGLWLELTGRRLMPMDLDPEASVGVPPTGWQPVRPAEHRWNEGKGSPVGQTVAALASGPEGTFYVVLEGGLLWIDQDAGGICRFEPLDAARPETRDRLRALTGLATGEPLISGS